MGVLLDSGSDVSLLSRGAVDALATSGVPVEIRQVAPVMLTPGGGVDLFASRVAVFKDITLMTSAGPLLLQDLDCFVEEANLWQELTAGRPLLKRLGYSADRLLVSAREAQQQVNPSASRETTNDNSADATPLQRVC